MYWYQILPVSDTETEAKQIYQPSELLDFILIGNSDVNNSDTVIWVVPKDYYLSSIGICLDLQIN